MKCAKKNVINYLLIEEIIYANETEGMISLYEE